MVRVPTAASPDLIAPGRSEIRAAVQHEASIRHVKQQQIRNERDETRSRNQRGMMKRHVGKTKRTTRPREGRGGGVGGRAGTAGGPLPCFQQYLITQVGVSSVDQQ